MLWSTAAVAAKVEAVRVRLLPGDSGGVPLAGCQAGGGAANFATSGLAYTILQPTFFSEIWLSPALGFDVSQGKARIYGTGTPRISWISSVDVARFAVAALDSPAARNAVIELGGSEALSPLECVRMAEEATGRRFEVEHVSEVQLRASLAAATDPLERSFAGLMLYYALGDEISPAAYSGIPVQPGSVRDLLKAAPSR